MRTDYKPQRFLRDGRQFLGLALKEFREGKRRRRDKQIRQAAEKAWNAAVQGTLALAIASGRRMPRSYKAQWLFLRNWPEDGDLTKAYLFRAFESFALLLHGNCFYYGEYDLDEVETGLREVRRFLDTIRAIVKK